MPNTSSGEGKYFLDLARRAIAEYFATGKKLIEPSTGIPKSARAQGACFVTLTIDGELRGCIGSIQAIQPLYLDVIDNALGAAFADERFSPLTPEEFKKTRIQISLLTPTRDLIFSSPSDLLTQLRPGIDGVFIRKGERGATYLPQVWGEFSNKERFLSSLCEKAGLSGDEWQRPGMRVSVYQTRDVV